MLLDLCELSGQLSRIVREDLNEDTPAAMAKAPPGLARMHRWTPNK